jgi:HAD superfamily hydrolase (TIGR01509 family)
MPRPAACLFDLDGLLLDTEPLHARAWLEATAAFGLHLQPNQLLALRGRRRLDCVAQVQQWLAEAGLTVPSSGDLLAVRQPIAEALLPTARPMPGAPSLVGRCQQLGIAMALVTSSSREAVALKAAPHPWLAAIGERVYGDDPDLAAGKPAPDPFRLAAQRLGVTPGLCWAFEDSPAGARSASSAGCQVVVLLPDQADLEQKIREQLPPGALPVHNLKEVVLS